ncbi:uncharacterized protein LOC123536805 [Mercenaria mercenaria]|uniref:uncharacterized protein LOC123536805 n=1 Tax=Mercenaria mercenaria TaxID=6596 RepID=UPI00234E56F9|nr:uncharacterized protein LOC123536805 [Mercenaria mercenaria]
MTVKGTILTSVVICIIVCDDIVRICGDRTRERRFLGEQQIKRAGYSSFYHPWLARSARRYHYMQMTDAGYGSRMFVASGLVRALIAHRNIFGVYGPGKKRSYNDAKKKLTLTE